jgi:hypothetical protein
VTMNRYARNALLEPMRHFCRAVDFLLLLASLGLRQRIPPISMLREIALVELGPGPMRLARVKRLIFREVFFIDQSDFGVADPGLRIADLEQFEDARQIVTDVCGVEPGKPVLFFADHCLEHVPAQRLLSFFPSLIRSGYLACFRVPNVLSPRGRLSFANDPTHQTAFQPDFRERILASGYQVFPWMRWYRLPSILRWKLTGKPLMHHAEEIAVCVIPANCSVAPAPVMRQVQCPPTLEPRS